MSTPAGEGQRMHPLRLSLPRSPVQGCGHGTRMCKPHHTHTHTGQVSKGYPSAREALVVNGRFLLRQLASLDGKNGKGKGKAAASLSDGAFAKALTTEVWVYILLVGEMRV